LLLSNFINKINLSNSQKEINSFLNDLENELNKSTTFYTVDRIEGNYAICENSNTLKLENISLSCLPNNIKQGNILKFEDNKYSIDLNQEHIRKSEIKDKISKVWNK